MPSSLALLPFPSGPDPITPTTHLPDNCTPSDKKQLPLPQQQQQQQIPQSLNQRWTAPWRAGLPTPPSDMMNGVAYNTFLPLPATNTASSVNPSSSSGSYYGGSYSGKRNGTTSLHPYSRYPSQSRANSSYDPVPSSSSRTVPSASKPQSYLHTSSSSSSSAKIVPSESATQRKSSSQSVPSYLQIPSSISDGKENLAEFAAQMTCLFWFESTAKLNGIEKCVDPSPTLVPEVSPASGFQKWVTTVLSTTQVSQNVILLALMFIYRLKKFNSGVKGKSGSEFRLLTIALMLGNKFLDDNTYTNKTWAEVSGIPVQEIHIMEVEFLSNVRYNLFASASEWSEWHGKLRRFFEFYRTASLVPEDGEQLAPITPSLRISPSLGATPPLPSLSPSSKLPSPPGSEVLRPLSNWNIPPVNQHTSSASYATSLPRMGNEIPPPVNPRKRSREEPTEEHPTKRIAMPNSTTLPPSSALPSMTTLPPVLTPTSVPSTHVPPMRPMSQQLPRPNIPTTSSGGSSSNNNLTPNVPTISHQPAAPVSLRPMSSTSYNNPPAPSTWVQQMPPVTTTVPSVSNGIYTTPVSLPDPSRHTGSFSSTLSPALPAYSAANTPIHLSPSFWLANRYSPYRPVRSVNTLLIPPPSASLQQHRSVPYHHMHYQPLGKSMSERRTGLVPYIQQETWPQGPISQPIFNPTTNYST